MKVLLVDGLNLVRRIFSARPENQNSEDSKLSDLTSFVSACGSSLQRALRLHSPTHCVAVFEQSGPTWRHRLYPDYKKKRRAMPENLRRSLSLIEDQFKEIGVHSLNRVGYEADDLIATIAHKIDQHGGQCIILSTDRNYCQLLSTNIKVFDHFGQRYLDAEFVERKFGIKPWQMPHLQALAGDSGMSIPGVQSIGKRTAAKLINDYGSLDKVIAAAENIPGKLGAKLYQGREHAAVAFKLFTLKKDIDLGINLKQYRLPN